MFIVFARDACDSEFCGMGPTPEDAWDALEKAMDYDVVMNEAWYRAEPVTVSRKTVFTVEG